MAYKFGEIAFTPTVQSVQSKMGSREAYARRQARDDVDPRERLGPDEAAFIARRDSFYMATVSETGWPYVQHRGGPPGFLRVLDETTVGFADYAGNRQYVSVGNLATNDRVSLFLMDYANKARLKLLGTVRLIAADDRDMLARLITPETTARIERGVVIDVAAFDWNCSQHIPERYSEADVRQVVAAMQERIKELQAQVEQLKGDA